MRLSSGKQLKIGAVLSYIAIGLNILSGLIYTPWMVRQIGDSDYGLYTLATSVISIFTIDFGMSAAVSRFMSKFRAEKQQDQANGFLGLVYTIYLLVDIVILISLSIVYFTIEHFAVGLTIREIEKFKVVFIMASACSVLSFPFVSLNGILTAYEKFVQLKVCDMLNKLLTVLVTVCALSLGAGLYALILINSGFNILAIVAKLWIIRTVTPVRAKFQKERLGHFKEVFGFSFWTTVVSISKRFFQNILPVMLSNLCTTVQITIYGIGGAIEGYAYMLVSAITGMLMPRISRIVAGDNKEKELNDLMCKVGRLQYFIIGLIFAGFLICGKQFVTLCYGDERVEAYYVALLMIFPHVFYAPQQIAQTTMIVENKVKFQAYVHVLAAVVNVALVYPLAKRFGAVGAAFSVCIIYLLRMLCMNILYQKILKLNMLAFYYKCYIKMGAPILVTILLGVGIYNTEVFQIPFASSDILGEWMQLGIMIIFVCVTYSLLMWAIGFNKNEKEMIGSFVKKLSRKH